MKIASQTADEMVLKEGSASGIAAGIVFVFIGLGVAYSQHFLVSTILWIAVAFFVVGLGVILFSSSITVDINKATGRLDYVTRRLTGGSNATYPITDILRVETRRQWHMERVGAGNRGASVPRQVLMSQSVILFKDGREVALDHQKSSSSMSVGSAVLMGGSGAEAAIANQVATFLGVPFQEIAPPNSGMGINVGGGSGNIQR
jgi:hypothetical protein